MVGLSRCHACSACPIANSAASAVLAATNHVEPCQLSQEIARGIVVLVHLFSILRDRVYPTASASHSIAGCLGE